ncbi:MAG: hypothetical protein IKT82_00770 [Bacteroidaceae bacterium]|nr:hypothetical protein [Bacteroidaceae bacterium]
MSANVSVSVLPSAYWNVTFTYADGRTETERFEKIVEDAREYIHGLGGFEAFAMWGLIRP